MKIKVFSLLVVYTRLCNELIVVNTRLCNELIVGDHLLIKDRLSTCTLCAVTQRKE